MLAFVNIFMMGKLSNKIKCIFRRFASQDLIRASYPDKNWSLSTLQTIYRRVDETGSAVTRRAASCRSKSVLLHLVNILNTLFKY